MQSVSTRNGDVIEFQGGDHSGPLFPSDTRQRTNVTVAWIRPPGRDWISLGRTVARALPIIADSEDAEEAMFYLEVAGLIATGAANCGISATWT